jgi:hypothetical protein
VWWDVQVQVNKADKTTLWSAADLLQKVIYRAAALVYFFAQVRLKQRGVCIGPPEFPREVRAQQCDGVRDVHLQRSTVTGYRDIRGGDVIVCFESV